MDSRPGRRKIARARRWGGQLIQMRVAADIRDLGARLSVHAATRCGTAVQRATRGLGVLKRLAAMPIDWRKKLLAVKTK
eukprot:13704001-Alexandrium_andersonii.AAC.1